MATAKRHNFPGSYPKFAGGWTPGPIPGATSPQGIPPAPPVTVYVNLSGYVSFDGGPYQGASIYVPGAGTYVTDLSGVYSGSLPYAFSGVATPQTPALGVTVAPTSRTYAAVIVDQTGQNYVYTTTPTLVWLSGNVTLDGNAYSGLHIVIPTVGTFVTSATGSYTGTVPYAFSGTAIPEATPASVSPTVRIYTSITSNQIDQNYAYTSPPVDLKGYISLDGTLYPNIRVVIPGAGTFLSDGAGTYSGSLIYGFSGTGTPEAVAGQTVAPAVRVYGSVTTAQLGQDYAYTTDLPTFVWFGGDITLDGTAYPNIDITVPTIGVFTSNLSGSYTGTLPYAFVGTATPEATGETVTPSTRIYSGVTSNILNEDYAYTTPLPTFVWLNGNVTLDGSPYGNVDITVEGVGVLMSEAASGSYSGTIPYSYSGTATPESFVGYTASPSQRVYSSVTTNQVDQNYSYTTQLLNISGYVSRNGTAYEGIFVQFTGSGTYASNAAGTYVGTVAYGYSGTAIPQYTVDTVVPQVRVYSSLASSVNGQDFVYTTPLITLTGYVSLDGDAYAGAAVLVSDVGTLIANASGTYTGTLPYLYSGTARPQTPGVYQLVTPSERFYGSVTVSQSGQDFVYTTIPPIPPTELAGTVASGTLINLSWADNTGDEYGFAVYRQNGSAAFTYIGTVAANGTSYADTGVAEDNSYRYYVSVDTPRGGTTSGTLGPLETYFVDPLFVLDVWGDVQNFENAATYTPGVSVEFYGSYPFSYTGSILGTIVGLTPTLSYYQTPMDAVLLSPAPAELGVGATGTVVLSGSVYDPDGGPVDVIFYGTGTNSAADFLVAVMPDMQKYYGGYEAYIEPAFNWIANGTNNVALCLSEGDITDNNLPAEYAFGTQMWEKLYGSIPCAVIPGNHDKEFGATTVFDTYFPVTDFNGQAEWGGSYVDPTSGASMYGNYLQATLGGVDWLFLNIGDLPHAGVIAWANTVCAANPNKKIVLTLHGFLWDTGEFYPDETLRTWEPLVKNYTNVVLLLCGHRRGEHYRKELWGPLATVHMMMANYQAFPNGGEGYIRLLTFRPSLNKIEVKTYSPYYDSYKTDEEAQFDIEIPLTSLNEITRQTGVTSNGTYTGTWAGVVPGTTYYWFVRTVNASGRASDSSIRTFTA